MTDIALPLGAGFVLLYVSGEALVAGAVRVAVRFGVSALTVGLTVVAFGTSSPELVVSLDAAVRQADGLVVGSIVGSNLCNLLLVLGLAALLRPIEVRRKLLRVDLPILIFASLAMLVMLRDGHLSRIEGMVLFAGIVGYTGFSLRRSQQQTGPTEDLEDPPVPGLQMFPAWVLILGGIAGLTLGAHLFVGGAVDLARILGVSDSLIGLTVVAIGTSLPEISAGVVAAWRGQGDLAVGNAVGSSIFNILCVLGTTTMLHPLQMAGVTSTDLYLMLAAPIVLLPFAGTGLRLVRWEGGLLVLLYAAYVLWRSTAG
ncbi:MAG: calcium/sodium antiporter [Gemmatimonadetes bacterium]|nr:calcium/sodium antiporter [Gemmatimonadota bacterium]MBT4612804.1 calcium/sodium antiporter [Gemmatimonadota bacterium]MBT5059234.1 calcium/sodium antiporter [Gemmatimonadota bacterium]MBT5145484.1 calcium/sodium antiporter [Gemmatimonadota bacterium]MBT5591672.1 calcium/sodium antiporter [Gemmatimonadota bacterium]